MGKQRGKHQSPERPSLWTRLTNTLNAGIWALPLPRKLKVFLSQYVYRNPPMPIERATATIAGLEAAGVRTVVMGGWGVDALAGRAQRAHRDLDLITDRSQFETAVRAAEELGYERWNRYTDPSVSGNIEFHTVQTMRDSALRVVELHEVRLAAPDLGLATGTLGEREVECLSPRQQLRSQPAGRIWTLRKIKNKRVTKETVATLNGNRDRDRPPD